jgi:hypothetical protein
LRRRTEVFGQYPTLFNTGKRETEDEGDDDDEEDDIQDEEEDKPNARLYWKIFVQELANGNWLDEDKVYKKNFISALNHLQYIVHKREDEERRRTGNRM